MGYIQWDQCDWNSRMKNDVGSMRVDINVELCQWSHISTLPDRSTHNDQFFNHFCKCWFLADRYGNIRHGSDGKDANRAWFCQDSFDQIIDCVFLDRLCLWLG